MNKVDFWNVENWVGWISTFFLSNITEKICKNETDENS